MARAFIALAIPAKVQQRLSEEADRLRLTGAEVAWVRPDNYHLTLRFLGEIEDEEMLVLDPMLREIASQRSALRLVAKGLGTFDDRKTGKPRAVWCGAELADGGDGLMGLRGAIERGLASAGYRRDKSAFEPHLTLGRVRGDRNLEVMLERIGPAVRREFAHFTVGEMVLFESAQGPSGTCYEPLQVFPFSG